MKTPQPSANPQSPGARARAPADRLKPARAAAGVARWRRAYADAAGGDAGGALDEPRHRLTLLKIFGSTCRLAEFCLKYPVAAASALLNGPSSVIAEAARDLSSLHDGAGGPDALHQALAPLKARVDLSIGVAEVGGCWTASEAAAARTEFAERLVETALLWLLRGGVNRGELTLDLQDGAAKGVFVLAGGDFAHEDLTPFGPTDMVVLYDTETFAQAGMAERAFVRLGAEFREAFAGGTGEAALFALRTPLGSGVKGAGIVESVARARGALPNDQDAAFRAFLATARVVAGDRVAGGAFLEAAEPSIWGADQDFAALIRPAEENDPRAAHRRLIDVLRYGLGRARPIFRTGSARTIFETAANSGVLPAAQCARLAAGAEFAQSFASFVQLMSGRSAFTPCTDEERSAIAAISGFTDFSALERVLQGAVADAEAAFPLLLEGPRAEFDRYKPTADDPDDIDKLEDLGFSDGVFLSRVVDGWAGLAACEQERRFSSIAPGLLTAFGETQHPDEAVMLFDNMMAKATREHKIFAVAGEENGLRRALVDTLGAFGQAVAPLTRTEEGVAFLLTRSGLETPRSADEWMTRNAPPANGACVADIAEWRRDNIARIAKCAAFGEISFGVAAATFAAIHDATLERVFAAVVDGDAAGDLALHVFDAPMKGLPGAASLFGFIATGIATQAQEEAARNFIDALHGLDEGPFAFAPETSHRPGGVAGRLTPDLAAISSFIRSEAVAKDQILLARARVIAGAEEARAPAAEALRSAVANARRADMLCRDLDRARAQQMRRERAVSEWDAGRIAGGLADVELIISTLVYRNAGAHPGVQTGDVDAALDMLVRSDCLGSDVAATLKTARAFWLRIATVRALARWCDPQQAPVRPRFAALIARAAEVERFEQVRPLMRGYAEEINRLYGQLVLGRPAVGLVANG